MRFGVILVFNFDDDADTELHDLIILRYHFGNFVQ